MEEPTLGSLEETSQNNSDLRIVLRQLIRVHGADTVKRELRGIEAAKPVENPRSRGRPVGPAIDDWPSLREAATLGRLAERGKFPQPVPLCEGSTRIGFVESEVLEWNAARLAAARGRTTWGPQDPLPSAIADPKPASGGRCHQSPSPDPSRLSGSRREQVHPQPTPDKTANAHPAGH
jgi:hypothetical protein